MHISGVGRFAATVAALVVSAAAAAAAQETQVEWSLGSGVGSAFTRPAPFDFDGVAFGGPYTVCPAGIAEGECRFNGLTDVTYALQANYPVMGIAGLDVRHALAGPLALDVGVLGGLAARERSVRRGTSGEVVPTRPSEPNEVFAAWQSNSVSRTEGVSGFAYVHAGLRWTHEVGRTAPVGSRPALKRLFLEAGGGWVPVVPGGADAGLGRPLAAHAAAGVSFRRGVTGEIALTARFIQALASADPLLVSSRRHWITLQVGFVPGR